ncbi:hypothetical protein ACFQGE_04860 [Halomicroarcula sp. GCM10025817]|jgi:hypothetical protein|uniref:hypothetical protein n=1 Tax=Haloarcula TaxID=2237 RepID=UPI0023E7EEE1|nr:hypothetical protein [Halomicroarcula sp. SYNS111]
MQGLLTELVTSVLEMPGKFLTVALNDPLAAVMLLVGAVITTLSVAAFGYLSLGAALSLLTPSGGRRPPRAE